VESIEPGHTDGKSSVCKNDILVILTSFLDFEGQKTPVLVPNSGFFGVRRNTGICIGLHFKFFMLFYAQDVLVLCYAIKHDIFSYTNFFQHFENA
jgi:hypothetical protein